MSGSMGVDRKRRLHVELSADSRVIKRLRSPNTHESLQLPGSTTKKEEASLHSGSVLGHLAKKSDGGEVVGSGDGGTDTSSSSSDLGDTSEEISSGDKDEASPTQVGETDKDDSDDSCEDDDLIQVLPVPRKPFMSVSQTALDLRTRLSVFLPQLREANADLDNATEAGLRHLDEVADDEDHYIEMNLGLGVLPTDHPSTLQPSVRS